MAFTTPNKVFYFNKLGVCLTLAVTAVLSGCASDQSVLGNGTTITASDTARMTKSGFLSDYARLKPTKWGEGIQCWSEPNLRASKYDKVLVSRIVVSIAPPKDKDKEVTVDPSDLKTLTDYFHDVLVKDLKPQMQVVDKAGPGVVVMRIALTDLVPTQVQDSIAGTLIPYAFVVEASSGSATGRPAGSTPYMGETGMEMQFRDGVTGAVLAECRDTEIGRKYAADMNSGVVGAAQTWASGYLNSFQQWSYAKNAFDKWAALVAQRMAEMRGVSAEKK
ncbi:MAG: DUF3313 family protein [Sheuella sp.]|nr:DUF3313 family protein [Sheuella sp.]